MGAQSADGRRKEVEPVSNVLAQIEEALIDKVDKGRTMYAWRNDTFL